MSAVARNFAARERKTKGTGEGDDAGNRVRRNAGPQERVGVGVEQRGWIARASRQVHGHVVR